MARRAALKAGAPDAALAMAENFFAHVPLPEGAVVSSYWAIGDEADPALLEQGLRVRGHAVALPRVWGRDKPLAFHLFAGGAPLVRGGFGLLEPAADWPEAQPSVLVVPLLAFDARGNRLGYGAGYYDRTLSDLRAKRPIVAVGFAYAGQEVDDVPHHAGDAKLDWVVTERDAHCFPVAGRV